MRKLLISALMLTPLAVPLPVLAQANDRVLTVFGDDKCPENTICVRAPEAERYRIPKNLREAPSIAPNRQAWAARVPSVLDAGAKSGIGSCTASGPGGWTGCYAQQMRQARAEREQAAQENAPDIGK